MIEYQSTLDLCGSLLVIVLIGFIYGNTKHYKKGHVVIINNIVFLIVLPCHIFTALRRQDWLDPSKSSKDWEFIASFLVLRVFMLLITIIITLIRRQSIFECVSTFLATCWISTIILGLPLCSSIFGAEYMKYGIFAALSSFFFQLPFMIAMFEIQKTVQHIKEYDSDNELHSSFIAEQNNTQKPTDMELQRSGQTKVDRFAKKDDNESERLSITFGKTLNIKTYPANNDTDTDDDDDDYDEDDDNLCCRITKLVLLAYLRNPIAWSIFLGFFFAFIWSANDLDQMPEIPCITTSDPEYWPKFLDMAMNSTSGLAAMTSPLGVLVIGLFAGDRWIRFWRSDNRSFMELCISSLKNEVPELLLYLFLKFFVCPAVMIGIVLMFGFDDKLSRIGVIIAVIPTSLASFILAKKYELKNQNVHALNVILGTLLMFPFVIMWLKIMDSANLFPDWK